MSGIIAEINLDGRPVNRDVLSMLTHTMDFRGPDAQQSWVNASVGLGHTLLQTSDMAKPDEQPMSLDGDVWITADVRLDDRESLVAKLEASGCQVNASMTDAGLILLAYSVWGEVCPEHLLGDFVFVIWDSKRRVVFCARDHFGVKPLFYTIQSGTFVISNTFSTLLKHPVIEKEINELAMGEFVLFGRFTTPERTIYKDCWRLPPARTLTFHLDSNTPILRRYWSLPVEEPLRMRHQNEYIDLFQEIFRKALADRLDTEKVGMFLSGGMDSASVAAMATDMYRDQGKSIDKFRGYTTVYRHLIPDEEEHYSGIVAFHLGFSRAAFPIDSYELFDDWQGGELYTDEPADDALLAPWSDLCHLVAGDGYRVMLTGEGGDGLCYPSSVNIFKLMRLAGVGSVTRGAYQVWQSERRIPPLYLRSSLKKWLKGGSSSPIPAKMPSWIEPGFARRHSLEEVWSDYWNDPPPDIHPLRPDSYYVMSKDWSYYFEASDPSSTMYPFEQRNPLFDLRLVLFALRLPPLPFSVNKYLLRRTVSELLPEEIVKRPKTHVMADARRARLNKGWTNKMKELRQNAERDSRQYINWQEYDRVMLSRWADSYSSRDILRPLSLVRWLRQKPI